MCFISKGSKLRIAFKNIECYKIVQIYKHHCISLSEEIKYEYDKKYSNKSKLILFLKWLFNDDVTHEGYHSFISKYPVYNVRCIIPKGSLYLVDDIFNEYCSTSIIIKKP